MNNIVGFLTYWLKFLRHPRAITLRRRSAALGDNLLLSCVAREIKRDNPAQCVLVETSWPELFAHNPHVDGVFAQKAALRYHKLKYLITPATHEHLIDQMIRQIPLPLASWERRLDLYYPAAAVDSVLTGLPAQYLVINPSGKTTHAANRKEWGVDNFHALRLRLAQFPVVQVGDRATPLLPNTIDRRGTTILETAHLIRHALTGVFLEGGLMHVANAVATPSVIIYGGYLRPAISGYAMHQNIFTNPPCSPCCTSEAALPPCPSMECMRLISVEQVLAAVMRLIAAHPVRV